MMDHLLPSEDQDVSILLERVFTAASIDVRSQNPDRQNRDYADRREVDAFGRQAGHWSRPTRYWSPSASLATPRVWRPRLRIGDAQEPREGRSGGTGPIWRTFGRWGLREHWRQRHPDLAHVAHHEAVLAVEQHRGNRPSRGELQGHPRLHLHPSAGGQSGPDRTQGERSRKIR